MTITPQFLDEMRSRLTLSEIIGRRVKVTRAGREFKACCPFHHEKTPSFTINDDKQFYHCFGCGAHGDVVKFVMDHDNLPFRETVETLAAEAGMSVPQDTPQAIEKAAESKKFYTIMADAAEWFFKQIYAPSSAKILSYMQDRGVNQQSMQSFKIGYAPGDATALIKYLISKNHKVEDMQILGLVKKSQRNNEYYSFFRDRVMFPVSDRRGRVIAFGGRVLPDHLRPPDRGDFKPPKYLNSPETPIFDKGSVLYAEDKARIAARDDKPILVTEGYMDVVACHQAGFNGAVAPMGTALTEGQVEKIWKMIPHDLKQPILCFDGDNAGQKAAIRACERILPLLRAGQSVSFAFLPEGEDPDSVIDGRGRTAFGDILAQSLPFVDYLWRTCVEGKPQATPEERAAVVAAVRKRANEIQDPEVQRQYKAHLEQKISSQFYSSKPKSSHSTYGSYQKGQGKWKKTPSILPVRPTSRGLKNLDLKILLAALLNHPQIFDHVEEQLSSCVFEEAGFENLKNKTVEYLSDGFDGSAQMLQEAFAENGYEKEMRDILNKNIYVHAAFAAPQNDSQETDLQDIVEKWSNIWEAMQEKNAQRQRAAEWKSKV